jgi:hypothetical protein
MKTLSLAKSASLFFGLMIAICFCGAASKANAATFVNLKTDQICLDVLDGQNVPGQPIDGATCNSTFSQSWNFEGTSIEGLGSANNPGYNCVWATGGANSGIVLAPCSGGQTGWTNGWYYDDYLIINTSNGLCITVKGNSGTQTELEKCTGAASQQWSIRQ